MVDTIQKALKPLHLIICFLGCGIFRHNLDHSRFCLSIFYMLTVWSVYACAFYYIVTSSAKCVFAGFLLFFIIMTNLLVTIISVIITICNYKKFLMCIKNLGFIDDTLEQLGTPKEYRKIRSSIKWILIAWLITICTTWMIDIYTTRRTFQNVKAILIPIILHYPFHVNTFTDITFIFLLRYVGTRLNEINNYIEHLSETKQYRLTCTWKKCLVTRYYVRSAENRKHVLWTALCLHLELCRIARNINNFYGLQMTVQMISYFVFLTGMLYFQYHAVSYLIHLEQNKNYMKNSVMEAKLTLIISVNTWCFIHLIKLVILNYICESVGAKAKKTKNIIHKLTNLIYFDQIRKDICQFILQISLRPLKFNGMGLFYFGYKFILKFIVGVVSIVIFMVQMDTSPLSQILISIKTNVTCKN